VIIHLKPTGRGHFVDDVDVKADVVRYNLNENMLCNWSHWSSVKSRLRRRELGGDFAEIRIKSQVEVFPEY
jgi:hypothetical protein